MSTALSNEIVLIAVPKSDAKCACRQQRRGYCLQVVAKFRFSTDKKTAFAPARLHPHPLAVPLRSCCSHILTDEIGQRDHVTIAQHVIVLIPCESNASPRRL